jgi:hypothetical protein
LPSSHAKLTLAATGTDPHTSFEHASVVHGLPSLGQLTGVPTQELVRLQWSLVVQPSPSSQATLLSRFAKPQPLAASRVATLQGLLDGAHVVGGCVRAPALQTSSVRILHD